MKTTLHFLTSFGLIICSVWLFSGCTKITDKATEFQFSFTPQSFTIDKVDSANANVSATLTVSTSQFQAAAANEGLVVDDLHHIYITACKVSTASGEPNNLGYFTKCTVTAPTQNLFEGADLATGTITAPASTQLDLSPTSFDFIELMATNNFELKVTFHQSQIPDWNQLKLMVGFDVNVQAMHFE